MRQAARPCTPLIYSSNKSLKKRAHDGRTAQKNVRPSTEMCASGAPLISNTENIWEGGGGGVSNVHFNFYFRGGGGGTGPTFGGNGLEPMDLGPIIVVDLHVYRLILILVKVS